MPARLLTVVLFATSFALPAQAISLDFVQTGGTAIGGVGGAGDTLILEVVATLESGEGTVGIFPSIQWDLEGGDVLDLVAASEPNYQFVNGQLMTSFSPNSRIGNPFDYLATSVFFSSNDPVYPSFAGPEAFFGLEQVPGLIGVPVAGPGTLTIGTLEFVLNSDDSTQISFYLVGAFHTVIGDDCSLVIGSTPQCQDVTLESDLGTFQVNPHSWVLNPEPSTATLFALGLVGIAAARRRRTR